MWHRYTAGNVADVPDDGYAIHSQQCDQYRRDDNRREPAEVAERGARQRDGERKGSGRHYKRPTIDLIEVGEQVESLSDLMYTSCWIIASEVRQMTEYRQDENAQ